MYTSFAVGLSEVTRTELSPVQQLCCLEPPGSSWESSPSYTALATCALMDSVEVAGDSAS